MSLSAELDAILPSGPRLNGEHLRTSEAHLEWPKRFGLITDNDGAQRHRAGDYAELACRFYPTASGDDLDLGVDLMSWFFLFDDQFDGPLGSDSAKSQTLIDELEAVLDERQGTTHSAARTKIAISFRDIWLRTCSPMPDHFIERARKNWIGYFRGYLKEIQTRLAGIQLSPSDYLEVRRSTIGVLPTLDMAERVTRSALPARVNDAHIVSAQRRIAIDVNVLFNDIASYAKELAVGELNNLVLIVAGSQDHDAITSAASEIARTAACKIREFNVLRAASDQHLPYIYDLSPAEQQALTNYQQDALTTLIRGSLDWHRTSGRYKAEFARDAAKRPHVDDLVAVPGDATSN